MFTRKPKTNRVGSRCACLDKRNGSLILSGAARRDDHRPLSSAAHCAECIHGNNRNRAKISRVTRQIIVLIVMLAVGLQGSVVAFASIAPPMLSDCQSASSSQDVTHKSCCPSGVHTPSCCLDVCVAAIAISSSAVSVTAYGRNAPLTQLLISTFFSRGDSPLTRPPIL